MEITNEIKAKVFAQYLGQMAKIKTPDECEEGEEGMENVDITGYFISTVSNHDRFHKYFLILNPLSYITDEDAISLYLVTTKTTWYAQMIEVEILASGKDIAASGGYMNNVFAYQFLQSKGYDLPNFLLGGKTLQELGLAIYE